MKTLSEIVIPLVLMSCAATTASANDDHGLRFFHFPAPPPPPHRVVSAPELDPAQGMAALALLTSTIAILRGRRGKK